MFIQAIQEIKEQVEQNRLNRKADGDYIKDGLLMCGECHTKKQTHISVPALHIDEIVSCTCKCAMEKIKSEERAISLRNRNMEIDRYRRDGISDVHFADCRFDSSIVEGNEKNFTIARNFAENWKKTKELNAWLLLYGKIGTGKTHLAACIANAVIDQCLRVRMTNFQTLFDRIVGAFSENKEAVYDEIRTYDLLIIDDLGIERDTSTMKEVVYSIINTRYQSGKPCVITTNLSMEHLKNPEDVMLERIYSRILEHSVPMKFTEGKFRSEIAKRTYKQKIEYLTEEK